VAVVVLLAVAVSLMPDICRSRWAYEARRTQVCIANEKGLGQAYYIDAADDPGGFPERSYSAGGGDEAKRAAKLVAGQPFAFVREQPPAEASDAAAPATIDRRVIRKATVELKTGDVRAVFLKAAMVINEAQGEYLEGSAITGSGANANAHLTLRVAADRLDAVLNQLRSLGEVRSEEIGTEDVTAQVVDVEARLRNEQRVETELLQLLEKRSGAPLKEVLELREKVASVREGIEKLVAQRDRLSRLVSLATVLVLIRAGDAPEPQQASRWGYFTRSWSVAWNKGMTVLADTVATLLAILVGGLFWWALLVIVILAVRCWRRRAAARVEKAPPERSV
jgi:hypothetical protein